MVRIIKCLRRGGGYHRADIVQMLRIVNCLRDGVHSGWRPVNTTNAKTPLAVSASVVGSGFINLSHDVIRQIIANLSVVEQLPLRQTCWSIHVLCHCPVYVPTIVNNKLDGFGSLSLLLYRYRLYYDHPYFAHLFHRYYGPHLRGIRHAHKNMIFR
jgi:hypothetical protein